MREYDSRKIVATNIYDLYEEYKEWISTINGNQRNRFKTTIVSTNIVQTESLYYMIITYSYE